MPRTLQPEILDTLGPAEPEALHSRRDLNRINRVMRNERWMRRTIGRELSPGDRILEIGAGTGALCRSLHAEYPFCDGLDLWPMPAKWPARNRWHEGDVFSFERWHDYDVIIGNLIFHQFPDSRLRSLGQSLQQHSRIIIACEPVRSRLYQSLFRALCPLIGANRVTRHDGHVSIAAGFRGQELPDLLGLPRDRWSWRVESTLLGAYRMVARRK